MEAIGEDDELTEFLPDAPFSPSHDFQLKFEDLTIGEAIGSGAFSTVYQGTLKKADGETVSVAIKKQRLAVKNIDKYLTSELTILKNVEHRNLITYYGACHHEKAIYIATELLKGGDLRAVLSRTAVRLSWRRRLLIARDALEALVYLHEQDLIHRDIKSENILVDDDWRCVLCDYGFARRKSDKAMTICGTDEYMAPEVLFGEEYDDKADIFSFGVVLAQIVTRKVPGREGFLERHPRDKFRINEDELRSAIPDGAPESLEELVLMCLAYDPGDRLDAEGALDWLNSIIEKLEEEGPGPLPPLPSEIAAGTAADDTEEEKTSDSSAPTPPSAAAAAAPSGSPPSSLSIVPPHLRSPAAARSPHTPHGSTANPRGSFSTSPHGLPLTPPPPSAS